MKKCSEGIAPIIIILIVIGILAIGGFGIWYVKTHQCPESCEDNKPCTQDSCSKETNYKCLNAALTGPQPGCSNEIPCGTETCKTGVCQIEYELGCCGNKTCETEEVYESCPADCPNCDDNNKCTADSYDYHKKECVNAPKTDVVCCGNTICENGETYTNCAKDCPDCNDDNKCTKDSYDYYQRKCVNKLIIPCCGNGICDKAAETHSICSTDCPNCNDKNKLTTDSFNYTTQKCENPVTHYFLDDFESGVTNWAFSDENGSPIAWNTITEGGNTVLRGIPYWGMLQGKEWNNYIFKTKFKIIKEGSSGGMHLNYRIGSGARSSERYMVGLSSQALNLTKSFGGKFFNLVDPQSINLNKEWHTIEIRGYDDIFNVYIDNKLLIKFKDTSNAILFGGIAFEIFEGSEFLLDDVEIKIINQKDISYP